MGYSAGHLRREVSDDMIESCDGRERCATVAFLGEALGAARMNQVAEFSGESGFGMGVLFDDCEMGGHFCVFVQVPALS